MNKIFRKCRDFGLMIRFNILDQDRALDIVKSLKRANLPLCVINSNTMENWDDILKEIAFKEDLFIAVEGVTSIEMAYKAAGNGAQFFILDKFNIELIKELKHNGFFFIPRVENSLEVDQLLELNIECVICSNPKLLLKNQLYNVLDNPKDLNTKIVEPNIFAIIDMPESVNNVEYWTNNLIKSYLNLNYTHIYYKNSINSETKEFIDIFSSTNKCIITESDENKIILECNDFIRSVNYFKWRETYISPISTQKEDDKLVSGVLDKRLLNFDIILKEKR